jgi:hypothetical protein
MRSGVSHTVHTKSPPRGGLCESHEGKADQTLAAAACGRQKPDPNMRQRGRLRHPRCGLKRQGVTLESPNAVEIR